MNKDIERDLEDRRLCEKYNILFKGPADPLPSHYPKSFKAVADLGQYRYAAYAIYTGLGGTVEAGEPWKSDTKSRADHLVEIASKLRPSKASEMKWRLDIEPIVFERFKWDIECPDVNCKGRLWRSEIEVIPDGPVARLANLKQRQKARAPCHCSAENKLRNQKKLRTNRLFADGADDLFVHRGVAKYELRGRKPDRVYGLQQKESLKGLICEANKLKTTPFGNKNDPAIFPFLVAEAKTGRGDSSWDSCQRQTAFPIWKLLSLQENLAVKSGEGLKEQGGPLVWFLANRGEDWRVYGCYTGQPADQRRSYSIHRLWSGSVDSPDGALQLLLIIDYIYDWARDLYRPSIFHYIERLMKNKLSDSRSVTDNDIHSLRNSRIGRARSPPSSTPSTKLKVSAYSSIKFNNNFAIRPRRTRSPDAPLWNSWEEYAQPWVRLDVDRGAFRPSDVAEPSFNSINIRGTEMNEILDSLYSPRNEYTAPARAAWLTMTTSHPILVDPKLISILEMTWTGKARCPRPQISTSDKKNFACISYQSRFSDQWKLMRSLSCIVLDETALTTLLERTLCGDESIMRTRLQGLQLLTVKQATDLIENIHNKSMIEHFVAATEERSWGLSQKDGEFAFIPSDDCARVNTFVANVKQAAYARERPYLCFSTTLHHKAIKGLPSAAVSPFSRQDHESHHRAPIEQALNKDDIVLLCHLTRNAYLSEENKISLCIFQIGKDQEPRIHFPNLSS